MNMIRLTHAQMNTRHRKGVAAIFILVLMFIVDLVILGVVISGSRNQSITNRRLETIRAFYAAEGGMNMAVREMMGNSDEDGDGNIGGISDDGDPSNDPDLGSATMSVNASAAGNETTLVSVGISGESTRSLDAIVEE